MSPSCRCEDCVSFCETFPGWMNPEEAEKAIASGFGDRLMLDWLDARKGKGFPEDVEVLAPAAAGYEGERAPDMPLFAVFSDWSKGRCVFLSAGKLCELHDSGFKPQQCRETLTCKGKGPDNYVMARLWDTDKGKAVIADWKARFLREG